MPSKYDCLQFSPCLLLLLSLYSALEHRLVPTAAESVAYYMHMHLWRAGHKPSAAVGKYMPEMCVCVCVYVGRSNVRVCNTHIHLQTRVRIFVVFTTGRAAWGFLASPIAFLLRATHSQKTQIVVCTARAGQQQKQLHTSILLCEYFFS